MDPLARLHLVASRTGLDPRSDPVALRSDSNDAWRLGNTVLRICWRGDRQRLHREALVLDRLPTAVPHPRLIDAGEVDDLSWTVTGWIDGAVLADSWPSMTTRDRHGAADRLAAALESLHHWTPDPEVHSALAWRPSPTTTEAITGADLNPLPVDRALGLIEPAKQLPYTDAAVLDLLAERLETLRPIDPLPATRGVVVHGDAHLDNILWTGSHIAALLDFEWARLGPPDLELQPLLRVEAGHPGEILSRLGRSYPALVEPPDLVERLWLYDLAFTLRHLIVWPLSAPPSTLPAFHPLRRLPTIVEGPSYIEALLDA